MAFHPEKCSAIRVTRSRNPISSSYTLKGHTLDSTKNLGEALQSNMAWNRHMDQTIKKANSTLGFLQRNLRISNEEPNPQHTTPWWGQSLSTALQSGTPTPKTTFIRQRWFNAEQPGMPRTDTGTQVAWPQCLNMLNGKPSRLGVPNTNWPCSSRS